MVVALALPGSRLPNGAEIRDSVLRGVASAGMLCSASELGLAETSEGLLELDPGATIGTPLAEHLCLDDFIFDLDLTPNRGDCLSVSGVAREVAALYQLSCRTLTFTDAPIGSTATLNLTVEDEKACPAYYGRVVAGIDSRAHTPDWLRERLRRGGIRAIHPAVDVTNYVMLELGQPMHAFDLASIDDALTVRRARAGETLTLLNQQVAVLHEDDLVIADGSRPLVLAGVMGGQGSGIAAMTTDVFLESACFDPVVVAAAGRRHKLNSDSRYRFERGVDPTLQRQALDRATALLVEICGGIAGPIVSASAGDHLRPPIPLRGERLRRLLGHPIPDSEIVSLLERLGVALKFDGESRWRATPPSHRLDLAIEADLIEEVARLYGYENIPAQPYLAAFAPPAVSELKRPLDAIKSILVARGFQEIITYSFVDPQIQRLLTPELPAIRLDNPIAQTMAEMRTSLWPGLIATWSYNAQRQQPRARLFEAGARFQLHGSEVYESIEIAGLIAGSALPEQWGAKARDIDFYDLRAEVEALFPDASLRIAAALHPALHPTQSGRILRDGEPCGWIGRLNPQLIEALGLTEPPCVFSLDAAALLGVPLPAPKAPGELPWSRRDLSLIVPASLPAQAIVDEVRALKLEMLADVFVFDVYHGANLSQDLKSIAMGLIFQVSSRTLTIQEIEASTSTITERLAASLGASVRF
jgi:phenylalanyl-tRNA synthetase beta chain